MRKFEDEDQPVNEPHGDMIIGQIAVLNTAIRHALRTNPVYREIKTHESDILACVDAKDCFVIKEGEIRALRHSVLQELLDHVGKEASPIILLLLEEYRLISPEGARNAHVENFGAPAQEIKPITVRPEQRAQHNDADDYEGDEPQPAIHRHIKEWGSRAYNGPTKRYLPDAALALPDAMITRFTSGEVLPEGKKHRALPDDYDEEDKGSTLERLKGEEAEPEAHEMWTAEAYRTATRGPATSLFDRSTAGTTTSYADYFDKIDKTDKDSRGSGRG